MKLSIGAATARSFLLAGLCFKTSQGQPENHICAQSQGLPFSQGTGGTTFEATPSDEQCRFADEPVFLSQKAWYNFTSNGNWLSLHMCPNDNNLVAEWEVRVQESCERPAPTCSSAVIENAPVDSNNFPDCVGKTPVITTLRPLDAGMPFIASVGSGNDEDGSGSFVLTLVNHIPPTNSMCSGAVPITVNAPAVEMNFANTVENSGGCVPVGKNLWFSFVGTGNQVAIQACSKSFEDANPQVRIQDSCSATQCICDSSGMGCDREFLNNTACPKGHQQLVHTEMGTEYWAYVGRDLETTALLVDVSVKDVVNTDSPTVAPVTLSPIAPGDTREPTAAPIETDAPTQASAASFASCWMARVSMLLLVAVPTLVV